MQNRKFKTAAFKRRALRHKVASQEGASNPRGIVVGEPSPVGLPKPTPRKTFPPYNEDGDNSERFHRHKDTGLQRALKRRKVAREQFEDQRKIAVKKGELTKAKIHSRAVPNRTYSPRPTTPLEKGDLRRPEGYNSGDYKKKYQAKEMADARHKKFESEVFQRKLKMNRSRNGR